MTHALPRVLSRLLVPIALLVASSAAHAQTIVLPPSNVIYRHLSLRPTGQQPAWVSQSDCLQKDYYKFQISMTGYIGLTLQVWAGNQGVDCTQVNERMPGGSAECWQLYSEPATSTPTNVYIQAVDLVARNTPDTATPLGYPDACLNNPNSPPGGQQLVLFFFFVSSGTSIVGTAQQWTNIGYDIAPPGQATGLTAGSGETRAHLNWTDAADTDIKSYRFFCDPPPGEVLPDGGLRTSGPPLGMLDVGSGGAGGTDIFAVGTGGSILGSGGDVGAGGTLGAGGLLSGVAGSLISSGGTLIDTGGTAGVAGVAGTAGTGGLVGSGTTTTPTILPSCSSSSVLQAGVSPLTPNDLSSYECGSVNGYNANSGTVNNLVNGVPYVFSVAAVDQVGNIGELSQNACATPVEVTDFFELYRAAGGKAGGGICSMSFGRNSTGEGGLLVGGALALALALRRRTSRRND
ncbi:MAG TPA: hypothetical protein VHC69_32005 [Polyangiaceae bacterium]|nr:hypothetical protein [Polyangiaceae bacterium]